MAVVLLHTELYIRLQVGALPAPLAGAMTFGYLGVDFFFVLSGFIIYHTNHLRVRSAGWPRSYAASRLTRIYIPYLPIGLAVALAYSLLPQISRGEHQWSWLSTITLLPSWAEPALHVAWTLQHELIFYALAFLMLWSGRVLLGSAVWAVLIVALLPLRLMLEPGVSPIDLEFLFGIAVAWCFAERRANRHVILVIAGLALVAAFFVLGDRYYSPVFGAGLALMILPLVRWEARGRLRVWAWLSGLGDASYAIYLLHVPLLSVIVRILAHAPPLLIAAVGVIASVAGGTAYHWLIELPGLRWARNRRPRGHARR